LAGIHGLVVRLAQWQTGKLRLVDAGADASGELL